MAYLSLYFFSYLLTYFGFLLGNSTKDEHKEIKKYVLVIIDLLKIIFYVIMLVLFFKLKVIFVVFLGLFLGYIAFNLMKKNDLIKLNDIVTFSLSFVFLSIYSKDVTFIVILMFAMIFENSFKKFKLKEEGYNLILYLLVYVSYMFLSNWF